MAGVQQCPDILAFRNDLAWLLATSADDRSRDGVRAVELATAVVSESPSDDPGFLDTLAAAYAETGDFVSATRISARALERLEAQRADEATLGMYREHLTAFEAGRPIRDD